MQETFLFYNHAGSINRGCEAIVRSTAAMLKAAFPDSVITLASDRPHTDQASHLTLIDAFRFHVDQSPPLLRRLQVKYYQSIAKDRAKADLLKLRSLQDTASTHDLIFAIGGDNYCYPNYHRFFDFDRQLAQAGKTNILWGCSIEPNMIQPDIVENLRQFSLITARETITYQALQEHGFQETLHLCADPAFTMTPEPCPLPASWQPGNTIGINISPLVLGYAHDAGVARGAVIRLIQYLLSETDASLALIPHVDDTDFRLLSEIAQAFQENARVILVTPHIAPQIKYIISQCRLFFGARTHATVAAYSTCVPTLVLGYSVKALGIARDLFGSEQGMIIPVQHLQTPDELTGAFAELLVREDDVRGRLQSCMPQYIASAYTAVERVRSLLNG